MMYLNNKFFCPVILSFIFILCYACSPSGVQMYLNDKPFEKLSEYQFFKGDIKDLLPAERVLPYDLNNSLFTDYAGKSRFIWLPEGVSCNYNDTAVLDFPTGSVLIKNFFYYHNDNAKDEGRRIIETRLLVHSKEGWEAWPYIWNDEQNEAFLEIAGGIRKIDWLNKKGEKQSVNYVVPNKNQCKSCHNKNGELLPVGPKVKNLNKSFAYKDGEENQLVRWAENGLLLGYNINDNIPMVAQWDNPASASLHNRAMAYLDINCAHCHNPKGSANTSGLNLMYEEPVGSSIGIWKSPVATGKGSGGREFSIVPGKPEASILVYRMTSTDPGAMMPELGRSLIHSEGVELIKEWITAMDSSVVQ